MEEEAMIQTPPQQMPMSMLAVDEGREALRKSGKRMLVAAIVKSTLIVMLYFLGYLLAITIDVISDYMDLYISEMTLESIATLMMGVAIMLIPSTVFMFCYTFSTRKAIKGNEKAFARSVRHLNTYFKISGIMAMVALFSIFVIILFHLWINLL